MPDYDFHQLSPYDLEILTRDLLQAHWRVTIESFKTGKDRGIDLRYAGAAGEVIVQVKHFARTGFDGLLRELKNEAVKVKFLQPNRYVIVTSVPLSAANKEAIVSIIGADLLWPSDVMGREDLNNLLGRYPEIEGQHYKLWLASRSVLDRVLNNAVVTRSEFKVRQVYEEARRYVQSSAYPQALKMLNAARVVIIAGPPGVGKTTLANLLLYAHLERGYQAVLIQRDIEEGQKLFQPGVRQVFYFDDFMGATFLGDRAAKLTGTHDRALLEFIAMIRETPTARLILTTREHIYAQAMDRSERLRLSDLDDLRVFLNMHSYSFMQKARILYNHVYFSKLPLKYQDALLRDEFYLRIIKHEKFNPRLIEWLSSFPRLRNVSLKHYRTFVQDLLRDPSEIWRHAYEQEITDAGRSMLLALHSLGGKVAVRRLQTAFASLHHERAARYHFTTRPEDFRSALRELAGTFIEPFGNDMVEVIDASVLDLLNAVLARAPDYAVDIVAAAVSFDQIERVWSFAKTERAGSIVDSLRYAADRLVGTAEARLLDARRVELDQGVVAYQGLTFERRMTVILEMADRFPAFGRLIGPAFTRLKQEWETDDPEINDAVDLIRTLKGTRTLGSDELMRMREAIEAALLQEASRGCRSDELRELISVIDMSAGAGDRAVAVARSAFNEYMDTQFPDELRDCRSREQFGALISDLQLFRRELGVEVGGLIERVEEARAEFDANEEARADYMQDEWKERWHFERASERSVSEMFDSLRGERD
jgi:DNA polymerase III delta prime subunit